MPQRNASLLFPIKRDGGVIRDICLAMKKRGFGVGRWNGAGGKVKPPETIEEALVREAREEFDIDVLHYTKVAKLLFTFPHEPSFDQTVHVYLSDAWEGEPKESDEMRPEWFKVEDIPYGEMWSDDILWLPQVLEGKLIEGAFTFAPGDAVVEHQVTVVTDLTPG